MIIFIKRTRRALVTGTSAVLKRNPPAREALSGGLVIDPDSVVRKHDEEGHFRSRTLCVLEC